MDMRELTYNDFKDIKGDPSWSGLDYLAAVAERASIILENPFWQPPMIRFLPKRIKIILKKPAPEITPSGINISTKRKRLSKTNSDDEEKCRMVTKPKKRNDNRPRKADNGPVPPPPLPEAFKNFIHEWSNGLAISEKKLVIQKKLFKTDVSKSHNRLSIPENKIENNFLYDDEKDFLGSRDGKKVNAMDVELIEPSLVNGVSSVSLRRWEMPKATGSSLSIMYVLTGAWNAIKEQNGLEEQMVVQLWAFRVDGRLCFALVKVPEEVNQN